MSGAATVPAAGLAGPEGPARRRRPGLHLSPTTQVALVAAAAVALRAPFVTRPLGSDEGGLLLVASQWHPGGSLYGDYWVDRPPLLLDVFVVPDRLGGLLALRCIGLVLVAASVVLAGRIGRLSGGSPWVTAATAAVFLSHPLLGVLDVNGELVAVPFVLASVAATLSAARAPSDRRRTAMLVAAGGLAAAAALVKQNEVDGVVLLAVGAVTFLATGRRRGGAALIPAAAGALVVTTVVLVQAAALGTGPAALWDAVVTFRLDAARVLGRSASTATTDRLHQVLLAFLVSGAPLLVVTFARRFRRRPGPGVPDLRWAVVAVLAWETFSVVGGGSYWLHYLLCLVPGLVLCSAVVTSTSREHPGRRTAPMVPALLVAGVSALVTIAVLLAGGAGRTDPVVAWLREHRAPGQTGLVAFGHPDYLYASGLSSPYEQLWSLPVRVRDPHLRQLDAVLAGPGRPTWVVTDGDGTLAGWGIDAREAQRTFDAHYRLAADLGDRRIYLDRRDVDPTTTPSQETP